MCSGRADLFANIAEMLSSSVGYVPAERAIISINCRDKSKIETPEELAACEEAMLHPRMSREVYLELKGLVEAYQKEHP